MKVAANWIKEYIETDLDATEMARILTNTGLEIGGLEKFESIPGGLKGLVIGEITEVSKHPNADKLQLTKVSIGEEVLDIVCGAPNVAKGQKVVVATVGSTLYPTDGKPFKIKKGKIRGEVSMGMICAEDEIGLGNDHDGIMVLSNKAKVGKPASEYFDTGEDHVLEIDLTPNRADGFSHIGAARDIMAHEFVHANGKFGIKWPDVESFKVDNNNLPITVEVKDKDACPRYSGLTISGLEVKESPEWLKNRLLSIGMKPINNVVDITNFIQLEMGQPLHAFDADKIEGNKVVVKQLEEGSEFTTLDEEKRKLSENDLMICNSKSGMCIAGVFGGIDSGVKESTKNIFIESAYFNPVSIRKTARRHGLNTDASFRYERGTDPEITVYALKRAAMLVKEIAGGEISSDIVDVYPKKIDPVQLVLKLDKCDRLIGDSIDRMVIRNILKALDILILSEEKNTMKLQIPQYRNDVTRDVDVIEEILRIYGYNEVPLPKSIRSATVGHRLATKEKMVQQISDLLVGQGFFEIMNNSLTKLDYAQSIPGKAIELMNPLSSELNALRRTMLYGNLEALRYNKNRKRGAFQCFEFGTIYLENENGKYAESPVLSLIMSNPANEESWDTGKNTVTFYQLKEHLERILSKLGVEFNYDEGENALLIDQLSFKAGEKKLGEMGSVSKDLLKRFEISDEVFYAELDWRSLLKKRGKRDFTFKPIAKYPVVRRDLALLLNDAVTFDQVREVAEKSGNNLLQKVSLFDIYKGKGLDAGQKSYAVSFYFGSEKKTLKDKEVDKAVKSIFNNLKEKVGADLRQGEI